MLAWLDVEVLVPSEVTVEVRWDMGYRTNDNELVGASEWIHDQGCCGPVTVHLPQNSTNLQPAVVVVRFLVDQWLLVDQLYNRGGTAPNKVVEICMDIPLGCRL